MSLINYYFCHLAMIVFLKFLIQDFLKKEFINFVFAHTTVFLFFFSIKNKLRDFVLGLVMMEEGKGFVNY